ncbi:hypothetical protein OE88DRAFT_1659846 [Heliocybe sulcata]|uniref:Pinin/SDK/MemA protein domain-containing protein n=1 Tax=Heliocybe sulcata TaxID=5364 RepID=A0A5C3MZY8_9AGAM|nr:hypothetical protein OE88DRAFT_1659846 [Heliocybe sulcata]
MFGLLVGTLNKAKIEEKEKSASEAAKKRQMLEQRLQAKLRKETDSVRRAEEAKKDKMTANRKEEELQLKDSIHKLRRTRYPLLANFLCTSDLIPMDGSEPAPTEPLANPARSHPPPIYYLPTILTPAQEAFLDRRKTQVKEAAEQEWAAYKEERQKGVDEIAELRRRVAEQEARQRAQKEVEKDVEMEPSDLNGEAPQPKLEESGMDVDDTSKRETENKEPEEKEQTREQEQEKKEKEEGMAPMQADDEDAVEY